MRPVTTTPTWRARQLSVPATGLMHSDHRHPGCIVKRATWTSPRRTMSTSVLSGLRDAQTRCGHRHVVPRYVMIGSPAGRQTPFTLTAMADVWVVDDDNTVASVLVKYLQRAGHTTRQIADGAQALKAVSTQQPDLIVLDLMLPGMDGLEVCRRVRATWPRLAVVMLTALAEPDDRIAGLELGADDYVTKPFSPRELVLRVDSVLRRVSAPPPGADKTILTAGDIAVDPSARRATRNGVELPLTLRELDLLTFLMSHPGQAFNREQLMREVWGWTVGDQSTVTVHVRRLREKVEKDPTNPMLIQTVWGIGYRLERPAGEG